ncbi:hypothetical protein [Promicromonospora sp. NPDC057488]|uniref:hypothetical protein n=1 Tax=Promicromonospora sp. NPDC057488 TaxID=3346147 RepID=UPI0036712E62
MSLLLMLALAAVVATVAVESARATRMAEGGFVPVVESTPAGEATVVKMTIDHLRGGRQYSVVFLSPGGPDAPLPPGVDEWPRPGTALVSPELLREGAEQGVSERYGDVVGTIGEPGLADASELLVYVRPAHDLTTAREADEAVVSEFGGSRPPVPFQNVHWLLANQDAPGALVWLVALCLVGPSLWFVLVATRPVLGRPRRQIAGRDDTSHHPRNVVGATWRPVSLGVAAAAVVVGWFAASDRRLPVVDYVVGASDLRDQWWAFALCAIVASAVVLCAGMRHANCAFPLFARALRGIARRTHRTAAALFPWFVLLAVGGPHLFSDGHPAHLLTGYAGLTGTVVTMPAAIAATAARIGRWLARRRRPSTSAVGVRIVARSAAVARQVSVVSIYVIVVLFTLGMQSNLAAGAVEADPFLDEYGYSMVEVHPRGEVSAGDVSDFIAALPEDIHLVAYGQTEGNAVDQQTELTGICPALESLALPCPPPGHSTQVDTVTGALTAWLGDGNSGPTATVRRGAPPSAVEDGSITLLAFTDDGSDIAPGSLPTAGTTFRFGIATSVPGETWYTGAVPHMEQAGWIVLLGGLGLLALVLGAGLGLASLGLGAATVPHTGLDDRRWIRWLTAVLGVVLPLVSAVVAGLAVGYLTVLPMAPDGIDLL